MACDKESKAERKQPYVVQKRTLLTGSELTRAEGGGPVVVVPLDDRPGHGKHDVGRVRAHDGRRECKYQSRQNDRPEKQSHAQDIPQPSPQACLQERGLARYVRV